MDKKWLLLDIIEGHYTPLISGEPALFTSIEFITYHKNYLEVYYGTVNRFEIIEVEAN